MFYFHPYSKVDEVVGLCARVQTFNASNTDRTACESWKPSTWANPDLDAFPAKNYDQGIGGGKGHHQLSGWVADEDM